ncbi:MAG: hypothetical protein ABI633_04905 [Burkholderiales bacterium]
MISKRLYFLPILLTLWAGTALAATPRAEYSVRWSPTQGGPDSASSTLHALGLHPGERSRHEVQYFEIVAPADVPAGFKPIMRKRTDGTDTQLTYKLRGADPLPASPRLAQWQCPLPSPNKRKDEADVTFMAADSVRKVYSRSCTYGTRDKTASVPAALQPRSTGCISTMTRIESGKLKVEQWQMADGSTLLEASRIDRDTPAALQRFRDEVVIQLLKQHIVPVDRSKSSIGGDCTR